jgi:hypothetical protein
MPPKLNTSSAILALEADLEARFLSDDLQTVCDCAVASANPIFICNATASLEVRSAIVEGWRAKQVASLVESNPVVANYLDEDCDEDVCTAYRAGLLPLESLSAGIAAVAHEREVAAMAAAAAANEKLERQMRKLINGTTAQDTAWSLVARGLVITADGTLKLFTSDRMARDWAVANGQRSWYAEVAYRGEWLN